MAIRTNCFREDCLANSSTHAEIKDKGLCIALDINRNYCVTCPFYMTAEMQFEREMGKRNGKYVPIVNSGYSLEKEWQRMGGYSEYLEKKGEVGDDKTTAEV